MPAKIKLDDATVSKIKEDFYNGITILDISKTHNISRPTLRPILKELGLIRKGRISQKDVDLVLLNKQYHIGKISVITGLDKVTISKILKSNNTEQVYREQVTKPAIVSRYEQLKHTFTPEEITGLVNKSIHHACVSTGFSESLIKRYANEYNIKYEKAFKRFIDISEKDKTSIVEKYSSGMFTMKELECMFGIGTKSLRKITAGILQHANPLDYKFQEYKKLARRLTTVIKNLYNLNPPKGYHVDHKISVHNGYYNKIPAYLIASFENLQIITSFENLQKGSSSSITKDDLYRLHGII